MGKYSQKQIKENLHDWQQCLEERNERLKKALEYHNAGIIKHAEVLRLKRLITNAEHGVNIFTQLLNIKKVAQ